MSIKLPTLRAALLAGVNAVFDVLEAAERAAPRRAVVRPPAQADGGYSETDEARAEAIARRYGVSQ